MKNKSKPFEQYLHHDIFGEEDSQKYLDKSLPIIGEIVMYFNGLESELDLRICEIFHDGTDAFGLIVLHKMNYGSKVDLFKRLNDELFKKTNIEINGYDKVIESLKKCGELRNLVVHADWENTDIEGFTYVKLRVNKDGMKQEYLQFSEKSLQEIAQLIVNSRAQLEFFWEDRNEKLNEIE
tara:strand:+ start:24149 stop:24691 length:543 start_codon:yes stop_codon:yes gene_type:complete